MNIQAEDKALMTAKMQTAVWLSDKLARLCREQLRAVKSGDLSEAERVKTEIDALVHSRDFADAVALVGSGNFYPDILRKILGLIERGLAGSIEEALRMIG